MQPQIISTCHVTRPSSLIFLVTLCATLTASGLACAQSAPVADAAAAAREKYRQEERINTIRRQQERTVDVRRTASPVAEPTRIPEAETPCFPISKLTLKGKDADDFSWLLKAAAGPQGDDAPQGRCLGGKGVNLVLNRLQNTLIAKGYITSQVTAESQDLNSGELALTLSVGRIQRIQLGEKSPQRTRLGTAIPARPGDVLNLREIEQGLENLKGIPSADADMKIVPADKDGYSDLVVDYRQSFPLRGIVSVDDSGTKATGKYQGSLTVAYDNPTRLNDLLYLTLNHDIGFQGGRGTYGGVIHYSVPFGFWNASVTYDRGNYDQTIAGAFQNFTYSGRNTNAELRLARVVYRDGTRKTTVAAGAFQRTANNFIDDTEVEVQRRRTGGWFANVLHRQFLGASTLEGTLGYKHGTGAFGSISAPEEAFNEGTSRFEIATADITLTTPFTLKGRPFQYQINWRGQKDFTPLAPPERFNIGGRYSVRGFDGESILSAERGWLLRNEIATAIVQGAEAYIGLDYGQVGGPTSELLIGKRLAGAVVGARGGYKNFRYGFFVGTPVYKPAGFRTAKGTAGFNLSYSF